jgi:putative flippase GtrA
MQAELLRYAINGLTATAVHYAVLTFAMEVLSFSSAGLANLLAAATGILSSFIGNRYFVFASTKEAIINQAIRFVWLYSGIAAMHATVLFLWTDLRGFDYRSGFIVATVLQVLLSYTGNKLLVFTK